MERMYVHADDLDQNQPKEPVIDKNVMNADSDNPAYTDKPYRDAKNPQDHHYIKTSEQNAHKVRFVTGEAFNPNRFKSLITADAKQGSGLATIKLTGKKKCSRKTSYKLGTKPLRIHSESYDPMSKYIW